MKKKPGGSSGGESRPGPKMDSDDHRWDLSEDDEDDLPECDTLSKKSARNGRIGTGWNGSASTSVRTHLWFPFVVTREEDEDDAYFLPGAAKACFRLGHKMEVLGLGEEEDPVGITIKVREKGCSGYIPLCDVEMDPKSDPNYWPVREYVVWFANR
jgi:hypothetical protein